MKLKDALIIIVIKKLLIKKIKHKKIDFILNVIKYIKQLIN